MKKFNNMLTINSKKTGAAALSLLMVLTMGITACNSETFDKPGDNGALGEDESAEIIENVCETETGKISICLDSMFVGDESLDELKKAFSDYDISVSDVNNYSNMTADEFTAQNVTVYYAGVSEVVQDMDTGKFADITDVAGKRGYLDSISNTAKEMFSDENGRIYALPSSYTYSLALMCNVDLFVEAGLVDENGNAMLPATWEEAAEAAQAIKEATGKAGFCFIGQNDVTVAWHFVNMAWNFGAGDLCIKNDDGTYTANVNSEGAVSAMEYIKSLKWQYDALTESPETEDYNTLIEKVARGEAAMCIGATDSITAYSAFGMDDEKLAVTALPAGPYGDSYSLFDGSAVAFSASASEEQIEAALDCIEYLGYAPVLNDASKAAIESLTDMEASADTERFAQTEVIDNFRCETGVCKSELYTGIADVIARVIADENADVTVLMNETDEIYQAALDEYQTLTE